MEWRCRSRFRRSWGAKPDLASTSERLPPTMRSARPRSRPQVARFSMNTPNTATTNGFLFADLRGYTNFVETHGDAAAAALLTRYRALVRDVIGGSASRAWARLALSSGA